MFQYEYEKRPPSADSCSSRATATTDYTPSYPNAGQTYPSTGQTYPSTGQSYPSTGQSYPSTGQSYPSTGQTYPSTGQTYPSTGKTYPSTGQTYPSTGQTYPNAGQSYPSSSKSYPSVSRVDPNLERARRPLPPRPIVCERMPTKTTVPLKVWIIASASCLAVCAVLVLATVVITKWGAPDAYAAREIYHPPEPIYANYYPKHMMVKTEEPTTDPDTSLEDIENEIQGPILKNIFFKNIVANRESREHLLNKPQPHPVHEDAHHTERKIEKKDKAKLPDSLKHVDLTKVSISEANEKIFKEFNEVNKNVPEFKPILPDVITKVDLDTPEEAVNVKLVPDLKFHENYINDLKNTDYEEYYNDENLYEDYMQSNSMTSYLIEKVQELHDWITSDPDFDKVKNSSKAAEKKNEFGQLLKALNESLQVGNVTIVMNKLRDMYFGENYTNNNSNRKVILTNGTDLLSFGILSLDVMLLHNIQLMAWENQESARVRMLRDPDVFAFNALFMDPTKVEAKRNEVQHNMFLKRQNLRQQEAEDFNLGANLFENVLEVGVSAARAAIHLGRAYKNTKSILTQLSNRDTTNIQNQISRNIDGNTHALNHLQTSFNETGAASYNGTFYTELDCVWLLYCRNLVATAKLNAPFGTMARINGMALRMLSGELSADKALDTMLYEALSGWTDLRCNDMFPRCSKASAASVVLESILQPVKKTQSTNRGR